MDLVLRKRFEDYSNPNKNKCLSENFVDMILTQMITGGSLIGLPYLPEDSELYVDIRLSEEAPVIPEWLDLKTLEAKRLELKSIIERLHLESPQRWPLLKSLEKLESIIKNNGMTKIPPLWGV